MRLMVAFDLPMVSKRDKRVYTKFRKFLLDDGFIMMQFSVYTRFCRNQADADKHIQRVKSNSPDTGNVRILSITEKQFEDMLLIVGTASPTETVVHKNFTLVIE